MYNILLKDYCKEKGINVIRYNMHFSNMYDGIHLNESGIKHFVRCMKQVMNPILGIVYVDKTDTNIRKNTPVYSKNLVNKKLVIDDTREQQSSGYKENRGQYNTGYNNNRGQQSSGYNNNKGYYENRNTQNYGYNGNKQYQSPQFNKNSNMYSGQGSTHSQGMAERDFIYMMETMFQNVRGRF